MRLHINWRSKKVWGIIVLLVLLLLIGGWVWWKMQQHTETEQRVANVSGDFDKAVNQSVGLEFKSGMTTFDVRKMPEYLLGLPKAEWFTPTAMQVIGFNLGLDDKSSVMTQGSQYLWQQDLRMLTIDTRLGSINFTTSFNLGDVNLPGGAPTEEQAVASVKKFLEVTKLPGDFYDYDGATSSYLLVNPGGELDQAINQTGPLLMVHIPLKASGVPVILPIENYVMIDAEGKIRVLSLFIPNLRAEESLINVVNINTARDRLDKGRGAVIESTAADVSKITVENISPAYYLTLREFYAIKEKRDLKPVYLFSGPEGKVAVNASVNEELQSDQETIEE